VSSALPLSTTMTKAYEFNWMREVPHLLQIGSNFELVQEVSRSKAG
jgi:hypothetical protein